MNCCCCSLLSPAAPLACILNPVIIWAIFSHCLHRAPLFLVQQLRQTTWTWGEAVRVRRESDMLASFRDSIGTPENTDHRFRLTVYGTANILDMLVNFTLFFRKYRKFYFPVWLTACCQWHLWQCGFCWMLRAPLCDGSAATTKGSKAFPQALGKLLFDVSLK